MSHLHDSTAFSVTGGEVPIEDVRLTLGLAPLIASLDPDVADFAFRGGGNRGFRLNRRRFVEAEWLRDRKGRFLKFIGLPSLGQRRQSNWGTDADGNETPNFQVAKAFRNADSDDVLAYARPIAPLNNQQQVVVEVGRSVNDLGRNPSPTAREIAQMPQEMPTDLQPGETRYVRLDPKQLEIVSDPTTKAGGRARLPENAAEAEGLGANDPEDAPGDIADDLDPEEARALEGEMRALAESQRGPIRDALVEAADALGGAQEAQSLREQENALDVAETRLRRNLEDLGDAMIGRTLASDRLRDFARRVDGLVAKDPIDAFQTWEAPEQGQRGTPLAARTGKAIDDAVAAARRRALNQPPARRAETQRVAQAVQSARDLNKRGLLNPLAARNTEAIAKMIEDGRLDWDERTVPALRSLATGLDAPGEQSQDDPLARRVLDVAGTTGDPESIRALRNAGLGLLNEPGDERRAELVNALAAVRERVDDPAVDGALASLVREAGGDPEARERLVNVPRATVGPERRAGLPSRGNITDTGGEGGTDGEEPQDGDAGDDGGPVGQFVPPSPERRGTVRQSFRDAAGDGGLWSDGGPGSEDASVEPGLVARTLRMNDEGAAEFEEIIGREPRAFQELTNTPEAARRFSEAIVAAKASSENGHMVTAYEVEDYAKEGMRLFLAEDGLTGFAINDGEILSVFSDTSAPSKAIDEIIPLAINEGGNRLDAFDAGLGNLYGKYGFTASARMPFNPDFRPEGWDLERDGTPDILFMHLDPSGAMDTYTAGDGEYVDDYDEGLRRVRADAGPETPEGPTPEPEVDESGLDETARAAREQMLGTGVEDWNDLSDEDQQAWRDALGNAIENLGPEVSAEQYLAEADRILRLRAQGPLPDAQYFDPRAAFPDQTGDGGLDLINLIDDADGVTDGWPVGVQQYVRERLNDANAYRSNAERAVGAEEQLREMRGATGALDNMMNRLDDVEPYETWDALRDRVAPIREQFADWQRRNDPDFDAESDAISGGWARTAAPEAPVDQDLQDQIAELRRRLTGESEAPAAPEAPVVPEAPVDQDLQDQIAELRRRLTGESEAPYAESASNLRDAIDQAGDLADLPEVVNASDAVDAITDESGGITPNADSQVLSDAASVLDDADIAVGDSGDTSDAAQDLSSALQDTADAVEAEADARAAAEQASGTGPPRVPLGDSREMGAGANPSSNLEGSDQEQIDAARDSIEQGSNGSGARFAEAKERYQEAIANGDEDAAAQAMADAQQALSDWAAEAQANGQIAAANKARALSRRIGTQLRKAGYPRTRIDRRAQPRARQRRAAAAERRRNRGGGGARRRTGRRATQPTGETPEVSPEAPEAPTPEAPTDRPRGVAPEVEPPRPEAPTEIVREIPPDATPDTPVDVVPGQPIEAIEVDEPEAAPAPPSPPDGGDGNDGGEPPHPPTPHDVINSVPNRDVRRNLQRLAGDYDRAKESGDPEAIAAARDELAFALQQAAYDWSDDSGGSSGGLAERLRNAANALNGEPTEAEKRAAAGADIDWGAVGLAAEHSYDADVQNALAGLQEAAREGDWEGVNGYAKDLAKALRALARRPDTDGEYLRDIARMVSPPARRRQPRRRRGEAAPATPEPSTDEPTRDTVAEAVAESPASSTTEAQVRSASNENDIAESVRNDPASNAARAERREGGDPDPAVEDALAQSGAVSDVEPSEMPPVVSDADAALSQASAARSASLSQADFATQMDGIDAAVGQLPPAQRKYWNDKKAEILAAGGLAPDDANTRANRRKAKKLLWLHRDFIDKANAARTEQNRQQLLDLAERAEVLLNSYLDATGFEIDGYTRNQDRPQQAQARIEQVMATPEPSGGYFYMDDYLDEVDYSNESDALQAALDTLGEPQWDERFTESQPRSMLDQVRRDLDAMLRGDLSERSHFHREERFERLINKLNRLAVSNEDSELAAVRDALLGVRFRSRGGVDDGAWDLDDETIRGLRDATIQFMGTGSESGVAMIGAKLALQDALDAPAGSEARWAGLMRARNAYDLVHATQAVPLMHALRVRVNPDRLQDMADPTFRLADGNIAPRRPAPRGRAWDGGEITLLSDTAARLEAEAGDRSGVRPDGLRKAARSLRQAVNAYNEGRYGNFEAFYSLALSRTLQAGDNGAFQRLAALRQEHWGDYDWGGQAADVRAGVLEQIGFLPRAGAVTPRDRNKATAQRHRQNARAALYSALQQPDGSFEQRAMLDRALWSLRQADDPRDYDLRDLLAPYDPNGDVRDAAPSRRNPNDGGDGGGLPPGAPGDMRVARAQQAFRMVREDAVVTTSGVAQRTGLSEDQARELLTTLQGLDLVVPLGFEGDEAWGLSINTLRNDGGTSRPRSNTEIDDVILQGMTEGRRSTPTPTPTPEAFAPTDSRVAGDETGLSIPDVGTATPNDDGTWTVMGFETETGSPAIEFTVGNAREAEQRLGQLADLRDRFAQPLTPTLQEESDRPEPPEPEPVDADESGAGQANAVIDDVLMNVVVDRARFTPDQRRDIGNASDAVETALSDDLPDEDVATRLDALSEQLDGVGETDLAERARGAAGALRDEDRQRQEAAAEAERQRQEAEAAAEAERQRVAAEAASSASTLGDRVLEATGDTETQEIVNQAVALGSEGDLSGQVAQLERASANLLGNAGLTGRRVSEDYEPDQIETGADVYASIREAMSGEAAPGPDYSSAISTAESFREQARALGPEFEGIIDRFVAALDVGDTVLAESILREATRMSPAATDRVESLRRAMNSATTSDGRPRVSPSVLSSVQTAMSETALTDDQRSLVRRAESLLGAGDAIGASNILRLVSLSRLQSRDGVPDSLTNARRNVQGAAATSYSGSVDDALVSADPSMAAVLSNAGSSDLAQSVAGLDRLVEVLQQRAVNPTLSSGDRQAAVRRLTSAQASLDEKSRVISQARAIVGPDGTLRRRPAIGETENQFVIQGRPLVPGDVVKDNYGRVAVVQNTGVDEYGTPVVTVLHPSTGEVETRVQYGIRQIVADSPAIATLANHYGAGRFTGNPSSSDREAWSSRFGSRRAIDIGEVGMQTPTSRVLLDPEAPQEIRQQALVDLMTSPHLGAGAIDSIEVGDGRSRVTVRLGDEGQDGSFTFEISRGDEGMAPVIRVSPSTSSPSQRAAAAQETALRAVENYGIANGVSSVQVSADRPAARYTAAQSGYDWDDVAMGGFDATRDTVLRMLDRAMRETDGDTGGNAGVRANIADMVREAQGAETLSDLPTPFEIASLGWQQGGRPSSRTGYKAIGSETWSPVRTLDGPNILASREERVAEQQARARIEGLVGELGEHRRAGIARAMSLPDRAALRGRDTTRVWARLLNMQRISDSPGSPALAVRATGGSSRGGSGAGVSYQALEFVDPNAGRRQIGDSGVMVDHITARELLAEVNNHRKKAKENPSVERLAARMRGERRMEVSRGRYDDYVSPLEFRDADGNAMEPETAIEQAGGVDAFLKQVAVTRGDFSREAATAPRELPGLGVSISHAQALRAMDAILPNEEGDASVVGRALREAGIDEVIVDQLMQSDPQRVSNALTSLNRTLTRNLVGSGFGSLWFDDDVSHPELLDLHDSIQGNGISQALQARFMDWAVLNDVNFMDTLAAYDVGAYAWPASGFDFASTGEARRRDANMLLNSISQHVRNDEERAVVDAMIRRVNSEDPTADSYPTPFEIVHLGATLPGVGMNWVGKRGVVGQGLHLRVRKHLRRNNPRQQRLGQMVDAAAVFVEQQRRAMRQNQAGAPSTPESEAPAPDGGAPTGGGANA